MSADSLPNAHHHHQRAGIFPLSSSQYFCKPTSTCISLFFFALFGWANVTTTLSNKGKKACEASSLKDLPSSSLSISSSQSSPSSLAGRVLFDTIRFALACDGCPTSSSLSSSSSSDAMTKAAPRRLDQGNFLKEEDPSSQGSGEATRPSPLHSEHHPHQHHCSHDSPAVRRALYGSASSGSSTTAAKRRVISSSPSSSRRDGSPAEEENGGGVKLSLPPLDAVSNGGARPVYVVELGRRPPAPPVPTAGQQQRRDDEPTQGPEEVFTTLVVQQDYAETVADAAPLNNKAMRAQATTNQQPIRIVFRTPDLDKSTKYCTSSTGTSPDFQGGQIDCSSDTVFTAAHRTLLRETILPQAAAEISKILRVQPVTDKLYTGDAEICGSQYTIPSTDYVTGVSNADYVVYVTAAPAGQGTVAWAGFCGIDQNGRPVVGRINFSPKYLSPATNRDERMVVRTAVHELIHALGFSAPFIKSSYFGTRGNAGQSTNPYIRKTSMRREEGDELVTLFNGEAAVAAATKQFACVLDGVELEDEGGDGTSSSHWERRFHKEDVMAGIVGDIMTYSEMTFGLLEDSGHYTIDRTAVEEERYMRYAGCGVFEKKCNAVEGGKDKYFCFDESDNEYCDDLYTGIGYCNIRTYASNLPIYAQYFAGEPTVGGGASLMNYCPVVSTYSNRWCNRYDNDEANSTEAGFYFGSDGKCFKTSNSLFKGQTDINFGSARCFKSRCPNNTRIEFMVGDVNEWIECPYNGSEGVVAAPPPYQGTIYCPEARAFCVDDANLLFGESMAVPITVDPSNFDTLATYEPVSTPIPSNASPPRGPLGGTPFCVTALLQLSLIIFVGLAGQVHCS